MHVPAKGKRMCKSIESRVSMKGLGCHAMETELYHKSRKEFKK